MKKLLSIFTVLFLSSIFLAGSSFAQELHFDQVAGSATGTVSYDGAEGALVGNNIFFDHVWGTGTDLHDGEALEIDAKLSFRTGNNTQEGPTQEWTWEGGGSFDLVGSFTIDTGTYAGTYTDAAILSGHFTEVKVSATSFGGRDSLFLYGIGVDTKHEAILDYFGITSATPFVFANTEISLFAATIDPDTGSFSASVQEADIVNAPVPVPPSIISLSIGLIGFLTFRRKML